jgi:hypothetical protein
MIKIISLTAFILLLLVVSVQAKYNVNSLPIPAVFTSPITVQPYIRPAYIPIYSPLRSGLTYDTIGGGTMVQPPSGNIFDSKLYNGCGGCDKTLRDQTKAQYTYEKAVENWKTSNAYFGVPYPTHPSLKSTR